MSPSNDLKRTHNCSLNLKERYDHHMLIIFISIQYFVALAFSSAVADTEHTQSAAALKTQGRQGLQVSLLHFFDNLDRSYAVAAMIC